MPLSNEASIRHRTVHVVVDRNERIICLKIPKSTSFFNVALHIFDRVTIVTSMDPPGLGV